MSHQSIYYWLKCCPTHGRRRKQECLTKRRHFRPVNNSVKHESVGGNRRSEAFNINQETFFPNWMINSKKFKKSKTYFSTILKLEIFCLPSTERLVIQRFVPFYWWVSYHIDYSECWLVKALTSPTLWGYLCTVVWGCFCWGERGGGGGGGEEDAYANGGWN